MSNEVISLIVLYTNSRAKVDLGDRWADTDAIEISAFIGLLLLAGVSASSSSIRQLWSSDAFVTHPAFQATMSRDRFIQLHRRITFDDFPTRELRREAGDRLAALSEITELVRRQFVELYHPNGELTIDEQLIAFRGRCQFVVYNVHAFKAGQVWYKELGSG